MNTKPTSPKPTWPIRFSPQVWRNRWAERLSEVTGPVPSTTITGTASQVTICQAMPMARTTIWPRRPARCWMVLRTRPTVPVSSDQRKMAPSRELATAKAEPRVGLPPSRRSRAPATSAAAKKVTTNVMSR